jgi:3-methyladenine DNA glycosylase AlkD
MPLKPNAWGLQIRTALRRGGSLEHAQGVQWFFKKEVRSHGWYTADLRRFARQTSREIQATDGLEALLQVADQLFTGEVLEEKNFAVLLLEKSVAKFGDREFKLFDGWLDRVTSWADHDALVHYLIGPMIVADPRRARLALRWAKSRNRWHRRAAAVSLIHSPVDGCCFRRSSSSPKLCSPMMMTLFRKAWDGCCAKPPRPIPRRRFPICSAFATALLDSSCARRARRCRPRPAPACWQKGPNTIFLGTI